MNPMPPSQISNLKSQIFIVRWGGNYAVQFHLRGFSAVADAEATEFASVDEAVSQITRTCEAHNHRVTNFTIEPLP